MTSDHWRRIDALYLKLLGLPVQAQSAALDEACAGDEELRAEVQSLLNVATSAGTFLDRPAAEVLAHLLSEVTPTIRTGQRLGDFELQGLLGVGGMGEVYRARDTRLGRDVAIKFLPGAFTKDPTRLNRFEREARVLAALSHPHIAAIYGIEQSVADSGSGRTAVHALVLELVEGDTLAERIARGRLPFDMAMNLARQMTMALDAAHGRGIVHRDFKPANIKVTPDGMIKVLDFGLAIAASDGDAHGTAQRVTSHGMILGTPPYMSPEQARGLPVDHRTDIWAFGCVVYEMLTGARAFDGLTVPDTIAVILEREPDWSRLPSDTPRAVREMLRSCLAKDRSQRPRDINEARRVLEQPGSAAPAASLDRALGYALPVLAAAAGLTLMTVIAPSSGGGRESGLVANATTATGADTIVLADFTNTTGDSVFDGTLKTALTVALEQSPTLKVLPDDRLGETLRLMGRPAESPLTREIAREVARREQAKALIAGSIVSLGSEFVITLEVLQAESGAVVTRQQVQAATKEGVLIALGQAVAPLRQTLGESLTSIETFNVPLARATTSSLDALKAYSAALDRGSINPGTEDIPHLQRAIALDPDFALALALLATTYSNTGQSTLAPPYAKRAFDLRDRVTDRERFFIAFRYSRDVDQDWQEALAISRSWTATYPREAFAFNSLGTALSRFGQFEPSLAPLREAIRLDRNFGPAYMNLFVTLLALDRPDEARAVLQSAVTAKAPIDERRLSFLAASYDDDAATMDRLAAEPLISGAANFARGWQGHAKASRGAIAAAHDQFRQGIESAVVNGFSEVAAQIESEDAEVHATVGQCAAARAESANALAFSRDNFTLQRLGRAAALCGDASRALALARELTERYPRATFVRRVWVPLIQAIVAHENGASQRAIAELAPLQAFDRAPASSLWTEYVRGQAYLRLKDGLAAAAQFKSMRAHRGEVVRSVLYPLATLGLARAYVLMKDTETARRTYAQFLKEWSDADESLPLLQAARKELTWLQ